MTFTNLFVEASKIGKKDFERMADLLASSNPDKGRGVAMKIKDKDKSIYRAIAGAILWNTGTNIDISDKYNFGSAAMYFYERAISLGATIEDFNSVLADAIPIADKYVKKYKEMLDKNLDSWIVGNLYKQILKMGYDVKELHSGNARTSDGKYAMQRNGRKWTIGYDVELTSSEGQKILLQFDAITDEGVDNTDVKFILDVVRDKETGKVLDSHSSPVGIRDFTKRLKKVLDENSII